MQNAKTYVKAENGNKTEDIRVLMDSGSLLQRTYIT